MSSTGSCWCTCMADEHLLSSALSSAFSIDAESLWSDVQEDVVDRASVIRKLNKHIMLRFCLLTILNNMDRANLVCFFLSGHSLQPKVLWSHGNSIPGCCEIATAWRRPLEGFYSDMRWWFIQWHLHLQQVLAECYKDDDIVRPCVVIEVICGEFVDFRMSWLCCLLADTWRAQKKAPQQSRHTLCWLIHVWSQSCCGP